MRDAAKAQGIPLKDYIDFESGYNICPHEVKKTIWAGIPPKFFVDQCIKCGYTDNLRKIDDERAIQDYLRSYPDGLEAVEAEWKGIDSNGVEDNLK